MKKKLITRIVGGTEKYLVFKSVDPCIAKFPYFKIDGVIYTRVFEDEDLDKCLEYERKLHERFNFQETIKETIVK